MTVQHMGEKQGCFFFFLFLVISFIGPTPKIWLKKSVLAAIQLKVPSPTILASPSII